MVGIEESYCNTVIKALLLANYALLEATITDAVQRSSVWGKGDTLGLDAIPEIAILECLKSFDQYAVDLFKRNAVTREEAISACSDEQAFQRVITGIKGTEGRKLLK